MKNRRIDPFPLLPIGLFLLLLALFWVIGAQGTRTHLREKWLGYAIVACWVAVIAFTLWLAISLLGNWADWYLARKRRKSPRPVPAFDKLGKKHAYSEKHPDL